jgi:hypothetical protein
MTIVPGAHDGPSVDAPKHCDGSGWSGGDYIAVHGHGARRFDFDRRPPLGPCDVADADPVVCPTVSIHAFSRSTLTAMQTRLGEANVDGLGLGVCADARWPLAQWNVSSRVHDWRFVDEALKTIDAELRRWNLGDDYGLSVSGISCTVVLTESRSPAPSW